MRSATETGAVVLQEVMGAVPVAFCSKAGPAEVLLNAGNVPARGRVVPKADPELDWAWRPTADVVEALNRGAAAVREYYRRQALSNTGRNAHCRILRRVA